MSDVIAALSSLNDAIFVSLVNTTLQITILISLISLIIRVFRIRSAPTRYSLWLFVLLAMLILPIITLFISQIDFTRFHKQRVADYGLNDRTRLGMESVDSGDMSMAGGAASSESTEKNILGKKTNVSLINPVSIVYFIWCAGALSMLCRTIMVYGKLRKLRLCSSDVESKSALEVLSRLREKLGIRRTVMLKSSPQVYAPIGLGVIYPTIILPDDVMDGRPVEELEMILAHELAHIKRLDYLVRFLQNLLKVFFFFHPLFQLMKRDLAREREHICDDWVIHLTEHRSKYAECLVSLLERAIHSPVNIPIAIAMAERKQDIPGRIDMIVDRTRKTATKVSRKALTVMLIIGCLALPVIGGIALVRSANAKPASDEGKIAFQSERDSNYEIYIMDADGANQAKLTNNPAFDIDPAWSPDGKKIAFASSREGWPDIHVMDADGSNTKRLTSTGGLQPEWSPNGRRIVFMGRGDFLDIIDADGENLSKLTEMDIAGTIESSPSWSPDGTQIIFHRSIVIQPQRLLGIYIINADGKNEELLNSHGMGPVWSPEGEKIAFYDADNWIYTMDADGSNVKRLTEPGNPSGWDPVWSPDGKNIAFVSAHDDNQEIYTMDADGANVKRLTNNPAKDSYPSWSSMVLEALEPDGRLKATWGEIKRRLSGK